MKSYFTIILAGVLLVWILLFIFKSAQAPLANTNENLNSNSQPQILNSINLKTLPELQKGDIIFRQGMGADSLLISKLSQSPYSHIGLIVETEPILVLHATTDDEPKMPNQVLLSSLEDFARLAKQIAIKRYDLSEAQREQIAAAALKFKGRAFVLSPEKDGFYCTSLIESAYKGVLDLNLSKQRLEIPALSGYYLLPKAFFDDNNSVLIERLGF